MCMYVHMYVCVSVHIFCIRCYTHSPWRQNTEAQAQSSMPFLMPLGYSENLICKDIKKLNSDMLRCYNAEVATLI